MLAKDFKMMLAKACSRRKCQTQASCTQNWDFKTANLINNIVPLHIENSYRTADSVNLVSVACDGSDSPSLMVEKRRIYRQQRDGSIDAMKHGSSHNEWNVWQQHPALNLQPNLVQMLGLTDTEESTDGSSSIRLYSQHCSGGDVDTMLQTNLGPLSELQVREIALDVVVGLHALHQNGLIHGDIKPSNVFINPKEEQGKRFLIGDYGSLRVVGTRDLSYWSAGFSSTIEYASPELLEHGSSKANQSSDVYALGILMQELVLGRLPLSSVQNKLIYDEEEGSTDGGGHQAAIDRYRAYHQGDQASLLANEEMSSFVSPSTGRGVSKSLLQAIESCANASEAVRPSNGGEVMSLPWFSSGLISSGRGHLIKSEAYGQWLKDWEPVSDHHCEWD